MRLEYLVSKAIHKVLKFNMINRSYLSNKARLCHDIQIVDSRIGRYTYIGEHSCVISTSIGSFCSIADHCLIGAPSHPIFDISTSPLFYSKHNIFGKSFFENEYEEIKQTSIGNDVWIGAMSIIKSGVQIGDGAVVGMGAVVTHNIPPYEVWAGNPAHLIKKRFDDELIEKLENIKWWEWEEKKLAENAHLFTEPIEFVREMEK